MSIMISQLALAATPLSGNEVMIMNQNGVTKASSLANTYTYTKTGTLCAQSIVTVLEGEHVSVKEFGAKGDGVTDDWLAIQRSIYHASEASVDPAWPATLSLSGDNQTYTVHYPPLPEPGATFERPRIWGIGGRVPVYFPPGNYVISKPLVIQQGVQLIGASADRSRLVLHPNSNCSHVECVGTSLRRTYPQFAREIHGYSYNAKCKISDLYFGRSAVDAAVPVIPDPTKLDWVNGSGYNLLSGVAGSTVLTKCGYLSAGQAFTPYNPDGVCVQAAIDFKIKLTNDDTNTYTITSCNTLSAYLATPLINSTPLSGAQILIGLPSMKCINVAGGENFIIDRCFLGGTWNPATNTLGPTSAGVDSVGLMVFDGSPGPEVYNTFAGGHKYAFWIENGPAGLHSPSGDGNQVFLRMGTLLHSNVTMTNMKIEHLYGPLLEIGMVGGSDAPQCTINGGTMMNWTYIDPSDATINWRIMTGGLVNFPRVNIFGARMARPCSNFLNATPLITLDPTLSAYYHNTWSIPNPSVYAYPDTFIHNYGVERVATWTNAATTFVANSATWSNTTTTVRANSATWGATGSASISGTAHELLWNMHNFRNSDYGSGTVSGTLGGPAATTVSYDGDTITSGTSATSWATMTRYRSVYNPVADTGVGGDVANLPLTISMVGQFGHPGSVNPGGKIRFLVGSHAPATPTSLLTDPLTARGFGFEIFYSAANARVETQLVAHNGTTFVTSTPIAYPATFPAYAYKHIIIGSDGAGTISMWMGGQAATYGVISRPSDTPVLTLAGGPTSGNYVNGTGALCSWQVLNHPLSASPTAGQELKCRITDRLIYTG